MTGNAEEPWPPQPRFSENFTASALDRSPKTMLAQERTDYLVANAMGRRADEVVAQVDASLAIEEADDALAQWRTGDIACGELLERLVSAGCHAVRARGQGWDFLDARVREMEP